VQPHVKVSDSQTVQPSLSYLCTIFKRLSPISGSYCWLVTQGLCFLHTNDLGEIQMGSHRQQECQVYVQSVNVCDFRPVSAFTLEIFIIGDLLPAIIKLLPRDTMLEWYVL